MTRKQVIEIREILRSISDKEFNLKKAEKKYKETVADLEDTIKEITGVALSLEGIDLTNENVETILARIARKEKA